MAYEICIAVADDGSISVGLETGAEEAPEMGAAPGGMEGGPEEGYEPATDIKDALMKVMDLYKNAPQVQGAQEGPDMMATESAAQDDMAAGFKSVRGNGLGR